MMERATVLAVGTYAEKRGAGLHSLAASSTGLWPLTGVCKEAQNVSFGAFASSSGKYFLVDEQNGTIGVFARDQREWKCEARMPTHGEQPCYVALHPSQSWVAVANYGSGSVSIYALDAKGQLKGPASVKQNAGSGPVVDRQAGPHAHCACFAPNGGRLYHVDLGTDEILSYALDHASGSIGDRQLAFAAPSGSGPRHLVFHPKRPQALLVSELASTLTVLDTVNEELIARQALSTLPSGFDGSSLGGHLSLNAEGDRAYVTNRGHDSVAAFAWHGDGSIEQLGIVPSGGASPRAFVLLEAQRQFVLANEEGGNVVVFDIEPDGTLSPSARSTLDIPGAAFLMVLPE